VTDRQTDRQTDDDDDDGDLSQIHTANADMTTDHVVPTVVT